MPHGIRGRSRAAQPQPAPVPAANSQAATQPVTQPAAPTRIPPSINDGKSFDFNDSDGDNDSEDQADAPQASRGRSVPEVVHSSNIQVNDPTLVVPRKGTAALDIDFFYDRQKGRDTFCKECRQVIHFISYFSSLYSQIGLFMMLIHLHGRMAERISSQIRLRLHPFDLILRNIIPNCT